MPPFLRCLAPSITAFALTLSASADTIVQQGSFDGIFGPVMQSDIILSQFDTLGGTRHLNFIQLDFLVTLDGAYVGTGSGDPIDIFAVMGSSYFLGDLELAFTLALFDSDLDDDAVGPGTLTLSDSAHLILDQPADLAPWIGPGSITLTNFSQLDFTQKPEDVIFFSATGFAQYSITYDYSLVPAPAAFALLPAHALTSRRRRRHH